MAVNLPPHYHDAEAEYKKARTPEEKLIALKKMWVILPKHKASEKVQMQLKSKISELNDEMEHARATAKKVTTSYRIPKQGAGQILLLGPPNSGKSRIMTRLTKANPEVAAYPFSTREPVPGMMEWEDIRIQLVELPPITADFYEPYVSDFTRTADAILLCLDLADDDGPFALETVIEQLAARKRNLVRNVPEGEEDPTIFHVRTVIAANKIDAPGAEDRLEIAREMFGERFDFMAISAENDPSLTALRERLFTMLQVMRIYGKQPGKSADLTTPFTLPIGSTVVDFAECVHADFAEKLRSAKVWGSAAFDGQTVKRDHILREKDVVELHI